MRSFLLIIHLLITCALVGVILLQKSEGGMGLSSTAFGPRATGNSMTRMTCILAGCFLAMNLLLAIVAKKEAERKIIHSVASQSETPKKEKENPVPAQEEKKP